MKNLTPSRIDTLLRWSCLYPYETHWCLRLGLCQNYELRDAPKISFIRISYLWIWGIKNNNEKEKNRAIHKQYSSDKERSWDLSMSGIGISLWGTKIGRRNANCIYHFSIDAGTPNHNWKETLWISSQSTEAITSNHNWKHNVWKEWRSIELLIIHNLLSHQKALNHLT